MIWYTKSCMKFNHRLSEKVYPCVVEYYYTKKSTWILDLKLETLQMFAY